MAVSANDWEQRQIRLLSLIQGGGGVLLSIPNPTRVQRAFPTSPATSGHSSPSPAPPSLEPEPPTLTSVVVALASHRLSSPPAPAPALPANGSVVDEGPPCLGLAWFSVPPSCDVH